MMLKHLMPAAITPAVSGGMWSVPELQTRAAAEFLAGLDDEDPDANRKPPKLMPPPLRRKRIPFMITVSIRFQVK